jgi:transposase InsO family protein
LVWSESFNRTPSCGGIGQGFGPIGAGKSQGRAGRPRIERELRDLIRRMCKENPLWGAPRIHGELLKLGFEIAESTVSTYMIRRRTPPSQHWRLRGSHRDLRSAVCFCCSGPWTATAVVVCGDQASDGRVAGPTVVEAFPWNAAAAYLVRDNDGAYGQAFRRRLRTMGIRDRPISPRSPWQNAYAERLIGTLRRDCLESRSYLQRAASAADPDLVLFLLQ